MVDKKPYKSENYNESKKAPSSSQIAKKDWHLFAPPHIDIQIKKDEPLPSIDPKFLSALKAEGVID